MTMALAAIVPGAGVSDAVSAAPADARQATAGAVAFVSLFNARSETLGPSPQTAGAVGKSFGFLISAPRDDPDAAETDLDDEPGSESAGDASAGDNAGGLVATTALAATAPDGGVAATLAACAALLPPCAEPPPASPEAAQPLPERAELPMAGRRAVGRSADPSTLHAAARVGIDATPPSRDGDKPADTAPAIPIGRFTASPTPEPVPQRLSVASIAPPAAIRHDALTPPTSGADDGAAAAMVAQPPSGAAALPTAAPSAPQIAGSSPAIPGAATGSAPARALPLPVALPLPGATPAPPAAPESAAPPAPPPSASIVRPALARPVARPATGAERQGEALAAGVVAALPAIPATMPDVAPRAVTIVHSAAADTAPSAAVAAHVRHADRDNAIDLATDRLGAVRVELDARAARLGVRLTVDSGAVATLLGTQGQRLEATLAAAGTRLDALAVDVRSEGGRHGAAGGSDTRGDARGDARARARLPIPTRAQAAAQVSLAAARDRYA